jgi:hypothetical protein
VPQESPAVDDTPVGGLPDDHPMIQAQIALEREADEHDRSVAETRARDAAWIAWGRQFVPPDNEYLVRVFALAERDAFRREEAVCWSLKHWLQYSDPDRYEPSAEQPVTADPFAGRTHGKVATYNAGCRCDACRAANTEHQQRKRDRANVEEDRVRAGLELLRETTAQRDEAGQHIYGLRTVGEVVRTLPSARWCVFGKAQHLSNIEKGQIRHAYRRCLTARCPHCAADWVAKRVHTVCAAWKDAPIWALTFGDKKDWTKRGATIRKEYPKRYFGVRLGAEDEDGMRLVFVPGEVEGSEPVEDVGRAICAALLKAPAELRGVNRHFGLRATPDTVRTGWWVLDVLDYKTANRIAAEVLGRSLTRDQQEEVWRGLHEYSHSISGLTEEEILRVRQALLDWVTQADLEPAYALGGTA